MFVLIQLAMSFVALVVGVFAFIDATNNRWDWTPKRRLAREAGRRAAQKNYPRFRNPHLNGSTGLYMAWLRGWNDVMDAKERSSER